MSSCSSVKGVLNMVWIYTLKIIIVFNWDRVRPKGDFKNRNRKQESLETIPVLITRTRKYFSQKIVNKYVAPDSGRNYKVNLEKSLA